MTRINVISVDLLNDRHLIAEYRELPRIFGLVRKAIERGEKPTDKRNPTTYHLGAGHVRFFYPRLGWLVRRQTELVRECINRGVKVQYTQTQELVEGIPSVWLGDYLPTEQDKVINIERINQRGGLRK